MTCYARMARTDELDPKKEARVVAALRDGITRPVICDRFSLSRVRVAEIAERYNLSRKSQQDPPPARPALELLAP